MTRSKQGNRLKIFDGLKGLGILAIIAYYYFEHLLPGGYLAVNLFLFIAGFFNFRHFYHADLEGYRVNTRLYYKRRMSRLFFPMLAVIVVTIVVIVLFNRDFFFNLRNMALSSLAFVNNYYQIFNGQSYFVQAANPSPFTHLWYVSLYAQLVLVTPILYRLVYVWNRRPSVAANILFIISLVSAAFMAYMFNRQGDPSQVYYGLLSRLFLYTLGGALGFLMPIRLNAKKQSTKRMLTFNILGLVCLILLFFMLKFMYGTQPFAYRMGMLLFSLVLLILIICIIHPSSLWHRLICLPIFTALGKRSYSYYLVFYPVHLLTPKLLSFLNSGVLVNTLVQFAIIIVLAELLYQIFESQSVSLVFGQDFNLRQQKQEFDQLRVQPEGSRGKLIASFAYLLLMIVATVALMIVPESRGEVAENLQEVIENNQSIVDKSLSQDMENTKVIYNIEGLDQHELLYANGLDVTFIGDSILLAAAEPVSQVFPKAVIDGVEGRQLYNSVPVVQALEANGSLRSTVIVMLGSNGTFTTGQINDFIEAIGPDRDQYYISSATHRSWVADANNQLFQAAQRYGNVNIIDWRSYSSDHPEWFVDDAGHPTAEGAEELAKFIAREVYRQR